MITNGFSIDLEEYFHAENVKKFLPKDSPSRVVKSTLELLNLLETKNVKATFFVLATVAKNHPELIRIISNSKHEIASHGLNHQLVYSQSPEQFSADISDAKKIIEDLIGEPVNGYRAPNFSITSKTPWAFSLIAKAGYKYDSSIYPIYHPRYGNSKKPRLPFIHEGIDLIEVPLATIPIKILHKNFNLPIAGGAYWRLLPLSYSYWGLKRLNEQGQAGFTYLHPWEIDPEQPKAKGLTPLTYYRHYGQQQNFLKKIESLISKFKFDTYISLINKQFQNRNI